MDKYGGMVLHPFYSFRNPDRPCIIIILKWEFTITNKKRKLEWADF